MKNKYCFKLLQHKDSVNMVLDIFIFKRYGVDIGILGKGLHIQIEFLALQSWLKRALV